jgi:hypothetical protein
MNQRKIIVNRKILKKISVKKFIFSQKRSNYLKKRINCDDAMMI